MEQEKLDAAIAEWKAAHDVASENYYAALRQADHLPPGEKRAEVNENAWAGYRRAIDAARGQLASATAAHPVLRFIAEQVMYSHPEEGALVLASWPFTRDDLDRLARQEHWCQDYDEWLEVAEEYGALKLVPSESVPAGQTTLEEAPERAGTP